MPVFWYFTVSLQNEPLCFVYVASEYKTVLISSLTGRVPGSHEAGGRRTGAMCERSAEYMVTSKNHCQNCH